MSMRSGKISPDETSISGRNSGPPAKEACGLAKEVIGPAKGVRDIAEVIRSRCPGRGALRIGPARARPVRRLGSRDMWMYFFEEFPMLVAADARRGGRSNVHTK